MDKIEIKRAVPHHYFLQLQAEIVASKNDLNVIEKFVQSIEAYWTKYSDEKDADAKLKETVAQYKEMLVAV